MLLATKFSGSWKARWLTRHEIDRSVVPLLLTCVHRKSLGVRYTIFKRGKSALGDGNSDAPMVVPHKRCLGSVKWVRKGDRNDSKVAVHGCDTAIHKFAAKRHSDPPVFAGMWTLSGLRLVFQYTDRPPGHGDILILSHIELLGVTEGGDRMCRWIMGGRMGAWEVCGLNTQWQALGGRSGMFVSRTLRRRPQEDTLMR